MKFTSFINRLARNFRQCVVFLGELPRERAGLAAADDAAVNLDHRHDFRAGAGQETFVRVEQIVARQVRLGNFHTELLREFHHRAARDAVKRTRIIRRREQRAVLDDEQIIRRAFGYKTFGVQHHGLFHAGIVRLDLGKDVVQIIKRFDGRVDRAVQIAHGRDGHDIHAARVKFRRIDLDFAGNDDNARLFAAPRIQAERANAARNDEADVAVAQFVRADGLDGGLHHFGVRQRNLQQDRLGRGEQAVNVFLQFEHAAIVGADALEHAVAVKQSVVEH